MQPVPDKVLQWLYSNLKPQYHNLDRAYSDIAKTLTNHPSLSPRTDIHTFENGASALLLVVSGTIPVPFRGSTYRYPLAMWIPYAYPHEPPMIYITPTSSMAVRPGQHVSLEGRVYHPYLAQWIDHWNVSNLLDLLAILRDAFAKEPPVAARQQPVSSQPRSPTQSSSTAIRSPPPEPAPGIRQAPASMPLQQPRPPPPPPKPPEVSGVSTYSEHGTQAQAQAQSRDPSMPPSLPPKPPQANGHAYSLNAGPISGNAPIQQGIFSRQHQLESTDNYALAQSRNSLSTGDPNLDPRQLYGPGGLGRAELPYHTPSSERFSTYEPRQPPIENRAPQPPPPISSQNPNRPTIRATQPLPAEPRKQIVDLLSAPVEAILPGPSSSASQSAPPIPPNPEKDAIVQALSSALGTQLSQTIAHNNAAVPALEAQHAAMQQAYQNMQGELSQLQQLDGVLSSNEKILHEAMREADRVMESVGRRDVPSVDDVLVAPTIVAEQLYGLVADVRGISDAMFALTRALDKGRVTGEVFIKQTRTLARERFFKEALIKKIARGMGLAIDGN